MASTATRQTTTSADDSARGRRRDAIATAVFGSWAIGGLFLDGWAHIHGKPESFFTPWHGLLYSGVGAAFVWFAIEGRRREARGMPMVSDRLLMLGGILFGLGAGGDFLWHEIFGIEEDLEALLSPTHLALMTGGLLFLGTPVRGALQEGDLEGRLSFRRYVPYGVVLTLTAGLVSFFTMYASGFRLWLVFDQGDMTQIWGVASVLFTNALLMGVLLFALRSWHVPFGAATLLFGGVGFLTLGLEQFDQWPLLVPALAAGVFADVLIARSPREGERGIAAVRRLGLLVPLAMWSMWFATYQVAWGIEWSADLWVGTIWLAVVQGYGLSVLTHAPTRREAASAA